MNIQITRPVKFLRFLKYSSVSRRFSSDADIWYQSYEHTANKTDQDYLAHSLPIRQIHTQAYM